jgi:hypothetical protein
MTIFRSAHIENGLWLVAESACHGYESADKSSAGIDQTT